MVKIRLWLIRIIAGRDIRLGLNMEIMTVISESKNDTRPMFIGEGIGKRRVA